MCIARKCLTLQPPFDPALFSVFSIPLHAPLPVHTSICSMLSSEREHHSDSQSKVQAFATFPGQDTLPSSLPSLTFTSLTVFMHVPLADPTFLLPVFQPPSMPHPPFVPPFSIPLSLYFPSDSLFLTLLLLSWVSFNCHLTILLISIIILYLTGRVIHASKNMNK